MMRLNPTPSEAAGWNIVHRRSRFGLRFRRQQIIQRFIVDLYCHALRLCLEIDGDSHNTISRREADADRDARLEYLGFRVVRVRADDISRETLERVVRPYLRDAGR